MEDFSEYPIKEGVVDLRFGLYDKMPSFLYAYSDILIELCLTQNRLRELPKDIGSLFMLQSLDVSHNKLRIIDEGLGQCIRLKNLNLSNNELTIIPNDIFKTCVHIENCFIGNNMLSVFPQHICRLSLLENLEVHCNMVEMIPFELSLIVSPLSAQETFLCFGVVR